METMYIGLIILALLVLFYMMSMRDVSDVTSTPVVPVVVPVAQPVPAGTVAVQTPEGYTFLQGKDSGGNDIRPPSPLKGRTVNQLKAACNNTSGCVGFNNNGWLKNKLKAISSWTHWTNDPNKGFYYKASALPN